MQTTIAILAGGESRRMGRDKAEIIVDGEALLGRTARLAREVCPRVCVVGRTRPDTWQIPDVDFWPDEVAGQGPLGGLTAALSQQPVGGTVLLVACDMPLLTAKALEWLIGCGEAQESLANGLVTNNDGQQEPLFSLYTPTCLALAQRQMAAGRRSLIGLIGAGQFAFVDAPPEVQRALRDVDTPEELAVFVQSSTRSP